MEGSWLNQPASLPELRLRELLDEDAVEAYQRDLMIEQALKAIVVRIEQLSAQVAEVRAAVGLPVEEPAPQPDSQGPASPGWNS
jgi:hypothetical protein